MKKLNTKQKEFLKEKLSCISKTLGEMIQTIENIKTAEKERLSNPVVIKIHKIMETKYKNGEVKTKPYWST